MGDACGYFFLLQIGKHLNANTSEYIFMTFGYKSNSFIGVVIRAKSYFFKSLKY